MNRPRKLFRSVCSGFTLVEILVVMTLMSIVMLGLGAAMRTIAQTEARVDVRLQRADEMRVATGFLFATLGRISLRKSDVATKTGSSLYLFVGAPDTVMWIGVMPARYGAGGRFFFRLSVEPAGSGSALVIRFVPWTGSAVFPEWQNAPSRVLVANVSRLFLEYGDDFDVRTAWSRDWAYADRLPGRVRISIATSEAEWPYLVVPMRPIPASESSRGGFSLGPE